MIYSLEPISSKAFQQNISTTSSEYRKFIKKINQYFTHVRMVKIDEKSPAPEINTLERTMFLTIIQTLKNKNKDRKYVRDILEGHQEMVEKESGKSKEQIKKIGNIIIDEVYNDLMSANKQYEGLNLNSYFISFIRGVCGKKQEKNFFGKLSIKYEKKDFQKIKKATKVDLHYLVYEDDKDYHSQQFKNPYAEDGYILFAKKIFYILFSRGSKAVKKDHDLDEIKILKNSVIAAKDIQKLFHKPEQVNQVPKVESSLFPDDVACYVCNKQYSQFDSLYWNYSYICAECLANPTIDTSNIPPPIVEKYCRDRNINYQHYDLICPECQSITSLKNYNPATKPKKFKCDTCTKIVCVSHSCNIFDCFCMCSSCKKSTIYMDKMEINYCQFCRKRFCFKCKSKGTKFCKCLCKQCLGEDNEKHTCSKKCHVCLNSPSKLRECKCGLLTCYGCYYRNLASFKKNSEFCSFVEFQ